VGDLVWQAAASPFDDPCAVGTAESPWLDLAERFGVATNPFAYGDRIYLPGERHLYCIGER
jgi:hypothetical protein